MSHPKSEAQASPEACLDAASPAGAPTPATPQQVALSALWLEVAELPQIDGFILITMRGAQAHLSTDIEDDVAVQRTLLQGAQMIGLNGLDYGPEVTLN